MIYCDHHVGRTKCRMWRCETDLAESSGVQSIHSLQQHWFLHQKTLVYCMYKTRSTLTQDVKGFVNLCRQPLSAQNNSMYT